MIKFMLDTNACISIINDNPKSVRRMLMQQAVNEVAISTVVLYELEYGICKSKYKIKNKANLEHFLKYVQVLDWSSELAEEAANVRCELEKLGTPIGHYDLLIAAHARLINAILVTHNTNEFKRVAGLKIIDWE